MMYSPLEDFDHLFFAYLGIGVLTIAAIAVIQCGPAPIEWLIERFRSKPKKGKSDADH